MSGKIVYSTFSSPLWKFLKTRRLHSDEESYMKYWEWMLNEKAKGSPGDLDFAWAATATLFLWKFRPIEHYFLAPHLAEFLCSSVKEFTEDFCRKLPCAARAVKDIPKLGESIEITPTSLARPERIFRQEPSAFALHFPIKERSRSILCIPDAIMFDATKQAAKGWFFAADDGEDVCLMQLGASEDMLQHCSEMAKLIFGFSLYIESFPEVIVSASCGEIHKVNHYRGLCRRVVCNDIAKQENERAASSPHFRRGHFRVLHSERFTKKRGQVVFVKGCFVKGKAYEVLSDAPPIEQREAA